MSAVDPKLLADAGIVSNTAEPPATCRGFDKWRTRRPDARWPSRPDEAFVGPMGDIVRLIEPHTEADPVGLLVQGLVAFGNLIGRGPHFMAEADRHALNLFVALVGESSKGRKGTSWAHIRALFGECDDEWSSGCIRSGLSSGEGLIWTVRDPIRKMVPRKDRGRFTGEYDEVVEDNGVADKRLLVFETEFASTLRVLGREGNVLSAMLRQAWDSGDLRVLTKNSPAQSTGAHISVVAHITAPELCRYLSATDTGNGFANRFLWVRVRRSKLLPFGGGLQPDSLHEVRARLRRAIGFARRTGRLTLDDEAREVWIQAYPVISAAVPGLVGAVTSRAEAQVMRLACLYALLDESSAVTRVHLNAALALWDYCAESATGIFGGGTYTFEDRIVSALGEAPGGLTRSELFGVLSRKVSAQELDDILGRLQQTGRATRFREQPDGRHHVERWRLNGPDRTDSPIRQFADSREDG